MLIWGAIDIYVAFFVKSPFAQARLFDQWTSNVVDGVVRSATNKKAFDVKTA